MTEKWTSNHFTNNQCWVYDVKSYHFKSWFKITSVNSPGVHCKAHSVKLRRFLSLEIAGGRSIYRPDALPVTQPTVLKHWGNPFTHPL